MIHRHVWKIVEKTEQPAPAELVGLGGDLSFETSVGGGLGMFKRPVIVTRRCERCGTEDVVRV